MKRILSTFAFVAFLVCGVAFAGDDLRIPRTEAAKIRSALAAAQKVELLSLYPHPGEPDGTEFHHFRILGSIDVTRAPERPRIVAEVSKAIARSPLRMIACFVPRHGIRAHLADGTQMDLLICFECITVYKFHAGKEVRLNIEEEPAELLNSLLRGASVTPEVKASGRDGA